ncbi:MAG TPA: FtsX-like permease family protein [Rhizomicrobium sp.]
MFRNHLVAALRNIARHKLYSFISIAGLAVGLACAIFILLFIRDELSYDKWIPGSENLYRVENTINEPGHGPRRGTKIPFPIPQAMLQQIPEVKAMTRLIPQSMTILTGNHQFPERVDIVDPWFFQVIRLPLAEGSPASVFAQPESIVLSQRTARKYFGDTPAMGRTITVTGQVCDSGRQNCEMREWPLVVTGIMRDLPHNTQLQADFLIPNTSAADPMSQDDKKGWLWFNGWGYVQLVPDADSAVVVTKLKTIMDRSFDPKKMINLNLRGSELVTPSLAPFRDDHLSTDQYGGMAPAGNWTTVYGFAAIGLLILLVACFNFTNLATARAMLRAREIGLRKCVGAARHQLIAQFLGESVLIALLALVLALAMVEVLLPVFDTFIGRPIGLYYLSDWPLVLAILVITVVAGLLSGVYPALVLSGFRPAAILRGSASASGSGLLRTSLVVLQFAVSIGLGVAMAVVFAQISFARNIDPGFQKSGVVLIDAGNITPTARDSFAEVLRRNPGISDIAVSDGVPFGNNGHSDTVRPPGGVSSQVFRFISISPDFAQLYHVRLLTGRLLSKSRGADSHQENMPYNALIDVTGAKRLGFTPQSVIGKNFVTPETNLTVVGVLDDIQMDGPRKPVAGTIYFYDPKHAPVVSVRVRREDLPATLSFIDRTWRAFAPTVAMQRHFLTDDFDGQFEADERQGTIFGLFVGIAIFISCLGLFGLAAFSTERRTREIGLRKTFGAGTNDIVWMLLRQFSLPVLIANAIAWPLAWYYLHGWLQGFAYRIALSPLYFVGAGLGALVIAWTTVLTHALRVARANPIHALRTE